MKHSSIFGIFVCGIALFSAALGDAVDEGISNANVLWHGNYTDRSSLDISPAFLMAATALVFTHGLSFYAQARESRLSARSRSTAAIRGTSIAIAIAAALSSIGVRPVRANAQTVCTNASLLTTATGSSQIPSPCIVPGGNLLIETLYYQNASKVGGTALAAYPLLGFDAGLGRRVDAIVDLPSQIAESGRNGAGIYPRSHATYVLRYGLPRRSALLSRRASRSCRPLPFMRRVKRRRNFNLTSIRRTS